MILRAAWVLPTKFKASLREKIAVSVPGRARNISGSGRKFSFEFRIAGDESRSAQQRRAPPREPIRDRGIRGPRGLRTKSSASRYVASEARRAREEKEACTNGERRGCRVVKPWLRDRARRTGASLARGERRETRKGHFATKNGSVAKSRTTRSAVARS